MNEQTKKDVGVILALVEEFKEHRFQRLLALKEKVDNGGTHRRCGR